MKIILLFILSTISICAHLGFLGKCGIAPKYRPLECYKNSVLEEDMNELATILKNNKNGGNDKEFADLIGDMFDKKKYREKKKTSDKINNFGGCSMHPKYLPVECYEENVLRRDKNAIRTAYKKYHKNDLKKFTQIYRELIEKKNNYYKKK